MNDLTPEAARQITDAIQAGDVTICYTHCWACIAGAHYNPPKPHPWADDDDIAHAETTGQPKPEGLCACPCAHGTIMPSDDGAYVVEADGPDIDVQSLTAEPCPECGAPGACAWDVEGRPLTHLINRDDLTDGGVA